MFQKSPEKSTIELRRTLLKKDTSNFETINEYQSPMAAGKKNTAADTITPIKTTKALQN